MYKKIQLKELKLTVIAAKYLAITSKDIIFAFVYIK